MPDFVSTLCMLYVVLNDISLVYIYVPVLKYSDSEVLLNLFLCGCVTNYYPIKNQIQLA